MQHAFLQVLAAHQKIVHKVCRMYRDRPQDQEDLFQEIVFQLWRAYPSFRAQAKISTWIYRIALNTAMASFRQKKPELHFQQELPEIAAEPSALTEREDYLYRAMRQLSVAERALISLYLDDYSYAEIADIVGLSENNVGVRLSRIKNKLHSLMENATHAN